MGWAKSEPVMEWVMQGRSENGDDVKRGDEVRHEVWGAS